MHTHRGTLRLLLAGVAGLASARAWAQEVPEAKIDALNPLLLGSAP